VTIVASRKIAARVGEEGRSYVDADARKQELLDKHNRKGVETGIRLQGEFFLRSLHDLSESDPEFAEKWLDWIYDYMYNRDVLDDRTRVLVIIGECVVGGHSSQLANHMRTALEVGATPEEIRG
jgi:alkylhydroperoxidase/carboxymuconolactone decarboxylase family protein YurZ